jgi:hypothetical protein
MNMTAPNFADDIPLDLARGAHAGTSFVPDDRGHQEREGYAATLTHDRENLSKHATTDEKRITLETEFARYREGYAQRTRVYLRSRGRCVSTMIAGSSNFPARRQTKINDIADRRLHELVEFRTRALAAITKTLHPELQPIMADDSNATERLREKIAKAEKLQEQMKSANAAIRKHAKAGAPAQIVALVALGIPESAAAQLLVPDFAGRIGFPAYELTNNGANIRRMQGRLQAITRDQATPTTEVEGTAARLEDDPPANRVRLFFPDKPSAEIRTRLKHAGFRWAPTIGAWQAYRNHHALATAQAVAGAV